MRVITPLRRAVMRMVYSRRLNSKWGAILAKLDIWPLDMARVDANGDLLLPGIADSIKEPTPSALTVIKTHRASGDLASRAKARFHLAETVEVEVAGIKAFARNEADLLVFHEIFVEQPYAFEFPGPYFVMDMGANIGLASLYFATKYDAEVAAYELVPSTAKIAQQNIDANPHLAGKITLLACGLSNEHGEFEIEVDPAIRTSNSLYDPNLTASKTKEKVRVVDAGEAVRAALDQTKGRTFVLKMDIEGAEYEVMQRLHDLDLLKQVDVFLFEWHERAGKDPSVFREYLRNSGFIWSERLHPEAPVGLINAFRPHRFNSKQ